MSARSVVVSAPVMEATHPGSIPVWDELPGVAQGFFPSFQLSLQPLTHGTTKGLRRARRLRSRWIPVISKRKRFRSICIRVVCVWRACVEWVCVYEQILYAYPDERHAKKICVHRIPQSCAMMHICPPCALSIFLICVLYLWMLRWVVHKNIFLLCKIFSMRMWTVTFFYLPHKTPNEFS